MRFFCQTSVALRRGFLALCLAGAMSPGASASSAGDVQTAAWTQQKFSFSYMGFQTRYTCFGLRTYIRGILLDLGARKEDLDVHEVACSRNHPTSVAASFWVLQPVPGARVNAIPAQWETVQVELGRNGGPDLGGCELAHQAMKQILPYFTARNAAFDPECTEHHVTGTRYAVRAEVLVPVRPTT
jgi:hypothetical protein